MKKMCMVLLLISAILLTGCIKNCEYTEEESDIYAEYIAGVLLASDLNYEANLIPYDELHAYEEIEEDEDVEVTPTPGLENSAEEEYPDEEDIDETGSDKNSTTNEVIAADGFDIQYESHSFQETYPENFMETYFSISAREGNQLLVVYFQIENISEDSSDIKLSGSNVTYQLDLGASQSYKPMLTLLENDIQYIETNVEAGEKETAILIFEVSNDIDENNIELIISKDDKTNIISLK